MLGEVADLGEVALDLGTLQVQLLLQSLCSAALLHFFGACLLQGSFCHQPLLLHHAHLDYSPTSSSIPSCVQLIAAQAGARMQTHFPAPRSFEVSQCSVLKHMLHFAMQGRLSCRVAVQAVRAQHRSMLSLASITSNY